MKLNSQILKSLYSQIWFAVLAWSLLILRFGYRFGTGDQVELLPYTLFLHDSTLYPNDFFIQGLNASVPNERTVMANLLLPFVNHLEIFCFIFQFLSTVVLIFGLERLSRRFIKSKYLSWLAILVALIPLNDFALGNVELYSECFQASGLAVAIIIWAIVLFLDKKYLLTSVLMSVATFIQLLEGLDVMMVLCAVLLIAVFRKEVSWKVFLGFISVYAFTAGIYLVMIFMQKNIHSDISNEELFKILFEFRHPHHFIFSSFSKGKMVVFILLAVASIFFFLNRSKTLFQFIVVGLAGVIVYAFCVDGLHNVFIGNFQFYKITQWMKFLGVVACIGYLERVINAKREQLMIFKYEGVVLLASAILCWCVILNFNQYLPYKVPFQIFSLKEKDDMISICEKIKEATPKESLFIQPFDNTELKYFAQLSSYVEFKANVRNKLFVKQWYSRLEEVFGFSKAGSLSGFNMQQQADKRYYNLDISTISELKGKGVTHILTRKEFPPPTGSLILQNNTYAVYQL